MYVLNYWHTTPDYAEWKRVFDSDPLGQPVVARLDDCISCSFCERHCPDFAIEIDYAPAPSAAEKKDRS